MHAMKWLSPAVVALLLGCNVGTGLDGEELAPTVSGEGADDWSFSAGWNRVVLSRWTTAGYVVIADAVRVR